MAQLKQGEISLRTIPMPALSWSILRKPHQMLPKYATVLPYLGKKEHQLACQQRGSTYRTHPCDMLHSTEALYQRTVSQAHSEEERLLFHRIIPERNVHKANTLNGGNRVDT